MPFGFDLEEVMGLEEEKRIIEKKTSNKYDHIYSEIQKLIDAESHAWVKIGKLKNYTHASSIRNGIKRHFADKSMEVKIRKYDSDGQVNFAVYAFYQFG